MQLTLSAPEAVPVAQVVFDAAIYPREKHSTGTVDAYKEALDGGSTFPPIIVDAEGMRILDGKHRWLAHQKAERETILVQKATLDGAPSVEDDSEKNARLMVATLRVEAGALNCEHGDRLPSGERQDCARAWAQIMVDNKLKVDVGDIARKLRVSRSRMYDWLRDILNKQKFEENAVIAWLNLLGWTQREIGEAVGLSHVGVSKRLVANSDSDEIGNSYQIIPDEGVPNPALVIRQDLQRGASVETIAEKEGLPVQLVQAIALDGMGDAERMAELKIGVQPYDVWSFGSCHPLMGRNYPGRVPGELLTHVLYFYTEPGGVVVDPMVGGGTTIDACAYMGRTCYGYDAAPSEERTEQLPDIIKHDILRAGWPARTADADLIFWDPPYFSKVDEGYSDDSISRLSRAEYLEFFKERAADIPQKFHGRLVFLCSDFNDEDEPERSIFYWEYVNVFMAAGWRPIRHIQVPLPTQQVHPDVVIRFREKRRLARLNRDLVVFDRS